METTPEQFAAICFLVLMDHHGEGYTNAHPDYISEKLRLLELGYGAFSYLDLSNQMMVADHLIKWNYKIPEEIKHVIESYYGDL